MTRAAKMEDHVMTHLLSSVTIVAALAIATPALAQRTGPGPFAETGTGPGVVPPGGAGSLLSAPQSAGWVSRSIHRGAVGGRAAAVLHPASALLCPAGRLLPAVRLLCPARPRLLRSAARLLLWAAGTVTRKSRLAGEPKDPGTACPSRAFPPLGPGYHHVDVASVAPGAGGPLTPRRNGAISAVFAGHLGIAELYPVAHALHYTMSRTRAALPHVIPHLSKQDHRPGRSSIA